MSSEDGRLKTPNSISVGEQPSEFPPNSKNPRESSSAPLVHLPDDCDVGLDAVQCAVMALSSWNKKSLSEQGPEYDLVEAIGCVGIGGPIIYHCNFIARPKNEVEAENKLFFGEIRCSKFFSKDRKTAALGCHLCCILGPYETGLNCCSMCEFYSVFLHHPAQGFTRGHDDAFFNFMYKNRRGRPRRAPLRPLSYDYESPPSELHIRRYVGIALSHWNEKSLSEQSPEYELVGVEGVKQILVPFIFHCNFIAKPKNESGAESKLFFVEMMYVDGNNPVGCTHICILGPVGTKTGLAGCVMCSRDPNLVQHPESGDFTKGRMDHRAKLIAGAEKGNIE